MKYLKSFNVCDRVNRYDVYIDESDPECTKYKMIQKGLAESTESDSIESTDNED